jgi:gamma-glutamyltranspeptidase/glutathione hydrolase
LHAADGKLPWSHLFNASIDYARDGFPLSEIIASGLRNIGPRLQNDSARTIFLPDGKPVQTGQWFKQTDLAKSYERIANGGTDEFYRGEIARQFVACSQATEGYFTHDDFSSHTSVWQEPVKATFCGVDIYELPPNGQGIAALLALNILQSLDLKKFSDDWTALTHATLESVKLAYAERSAHIADPQQNPAPLDELLSLTFATHAGMTIDPTRAIARDASLVGHRDGGTVYICTADAEGNVVSLISSLYSAGCGIVPDGTGIMLHNRAAGFTLEGGHPNLMLPQKRPFHTIVPGFALKNGDPYLAFGVMGGHHQAQGHVQVLINLLIHEMNLQEAVSAPRFDFRTGNFVALEADFPEELRVALEQKGHRIVEKDVGPFGGGQLLRVRADGVYEGASDPRKDGCAIGY